METKICKKCGKELPLDNFYRASGNKDGHEGVCKKCRKESKMRHKRICPQCGKEFISDRKNQKHCSRECSDKSKSKSHEQFIKDLAMIHPTIKVLSDYTKSSAKIKVKCMVCNHEYETEANSLLQGHGCPNCYDNRRGDTLKMTHEEFINRIDDNIEVLEIYTNSTTKIKCRCKLDNHIWYPQAGSLLQGHGCPECKARNSRNDELTDEDREEKRNIEGYKEWRISVYKRDNYNCQCCGKHGGKLIAHHKDGYGWCKEKRTDINNGVTLCPNCHSEFHSIYGYGNNTEEQYNEFIDNKNKEAS